MIATTTTTEGGGALEGTMTTTAVIDDVGVGPGTTGTTIRGKARPARIAIQGNIGEEDPCHMRTRTGRRRPNSPTSNPWKTTSARRAKRRRTRTRRGIDPRGRRTDGRGPKTARGDDDRRLASDRGPRAARTSSMRKLSQQETGKGPRRPIRPRRRRPSSSRIDLALPCPKLPVLLNGGRRRRPASSSHLRILTLLYGPTGAILPKERSRRSLL